MPRTLQIHLGQFSDRGVNLVEERIDIALRITNVLDPTLIARQLGTCHSLLCASPDYLARHGMPTRPEDLSRHNCLTYTYISRSEWRLSRGNQTLPVQVGGNLSGNPWGAVIILIGSMSWAFGSVYGSRIELPTGMMAGAIEMLAAWIVLLLASTLTGEKLTALPDLSGFLAVGYLALFGSIIAINAYMFLIRNVSPAVATSYAYVNPVVAVLLGTGLGGETLSPVEWIALGIIVFAVVLVTLGKYLLPAKPVVTPCEVEKP